jgi:lon-related putative ATP-dependent protease
MPVPQPLPPEALYKTCDPQQFAFASTAEVEDGHQIIGQDRAVASIQFGIGIQREGYNLYALGSHGTGKYTAVHQFLAQKAAAEPTPSDWCYVHNFEQAHKSHALRLPAGMATELRDDMQKLVEELVTILPAAFTSEEYQAQKKVLEEEYKSQQTQALEKLRSQARLNNIALIQTPGGFAFAPLKEGEVVSPDEFLQLSREEQTKIEAQVEDLQETLQDIMRQVPQWQRTAQRRLKEMNREVAGFAIMPLLNELRQKYADLENVQAYFSAVQRDIIENFDIFLEEEKTTMAAMMGMAAAQQESSLRRYQVNVLVDHRATEGAPIVFEAQPRYQNLVGRVEHISQMGALVTDFTLIKPGALHRANGGYLVLEARSLLMQPYAWDGLKHALRAGEINIESLGQVYSLVSTVSLEPEPIPLDVKVIMLGERLLYYLLCHYEPDFPELFKVAADFEDDMERSDASNQAYAQLIAALVRKEQMRHFDRAAVARVIEHSSRQAGDAEKLSIHMQSISDLLREADYWAAENSHEVVTVVDVQRALDAQIYRASRIRDRIQESILRDTILIDTEGETLGQINGLAVYQTGQFAFAKPSRITARVRMGKGEVIDIERQVEMGGPIHSKGVMILAGFLGARYAAERPFPLSATLVFEQSYGGVDGDSASSAELYALLSVLAQAPLKQSLAVTGSVNQHGQVQAIGGVNEKIEGFFDVCNARGLTGAQGVLIPQANVKNLMLRQDVVEAVRDGRFHVYPVAHVDEGIELLTGVAAGAPDADGNYPPESINGRVVAWLTQTAEEQRRFTAPPREGDAESRKEESRDKPDA